VSRFRGNRGWGINGTDTRGGASGAGLPRANILSPFRAFNQACCASLPKSYVKERPTDHSYYKIQPSQWKLDSKLFTLFRGSPAPRDGYEAANGIRASRGFAIGGNVFGAGYPGLKAGAIYRMSFRDNDDRG
jgi:hypothetical protein